MNILKKVILPVLGALDPTGIIDSIRPKDISDKTGIAENVVSSVISAIKEDPAILEAKNKHTEAMAQIESSNLQGLDTDSTFSFSQGLLGSPRRWAVTLTSSAITLLGIIVGIKAIFFTQAIADPEALKEVMESLGLTCFGLAGVYASKYFGKSRRDP